jgi:TRAP-type mannitol/chloroaromatic compound transport system permease small subunit
MKIRQVARAVRAIDRVAELCGVAVAWLMVPLIVAVVYEVVARYAFAAPTLWSFDVTYMLYGAIFMLGAAYALRIGAHIRTDFFWERWSLRTRGIIDAIAYAVFFFPGIATWLPDQLFRSGALVVSDPAPAATSSSQTYGETYEQTYKRSLESLPAQ